MNRARVFVVLAALLALSGCSGLPGASTAVPSATPTDGPDPTATAVGHTPIVDDVDVEYPHDIVVDNDLDEDVEVTIGVEHEGALIYNETHAVRSGPEVTVAGITRETLPDGARSLTVTATTSDGQSTSVQVSVTDCLGDVVFAVTDEGDLQGTYSIC